MILHDILNAKKNDIIIYKLTDETSP